MMSQEEIDAMNDEVKQTRLYQYGKQANSAQALSRMGEIVSNIGQELQDAAERTIDLNDMDMVQEQTQSYINSCAERGLIPSKAGLSRALGLTRQAADVYIRAHPQSKTAHYLSLVFDAFSEALSLAGLYGQAHPIVCLFLLKSIHGLRDNFITIEDASQYDPKPTVAEIQAKYAHLLSDYTAEAETEITKKIKEDK